MATTTLSRRCVNLAMGTGAAGRSHALYDPQPIGLLVPAIGTWRGSRVYRDDQNAERQVTLHTRLAISPAAPDELALYDLYDDGPGKRVHSYERMSFDLTGGQLAWISGTARPKRTLCAITGSEPAEPGGRIRFEREVEGGVDRFLPDIGVRTWSLGKRELRSGKAELERNRFELRKVDG